MKKILLKTRLRTKVALGLILVILPVILISLFHPSDPRAAWMDDNWAYRKSLSITHNAVVTNNKVKIEIDTATLITANKMQSDCGDSRFVDASGTQLRYYMNAGGGAGVGCNDASTDYYVLIPTINNGTTVIFHYYGNPSAPNGTEAAQLDDFTTLSPSGGAASAGSEVSGLGPVAMWHFDEGVDNTCSGGTNDACDTTSNANNGAISNGTAWQTGDMCVSGRCLYFDGSNDIVTVTNAAAIDLDGRLSGGFSFEAWINPNNAGEGSGGQIFYKSSTTFFRVDTLSGGRLDVEASVDLATTDATLNVASAVPANQWSHVVLSYTDDADDEISIWVNGKLVGTSTNGVGSLSADTANLVIGGTTTDNFQGFIDEFRIYNYERSSTQVQADAIPGNGFKGSSAGMSATNFNALSSGLIGYWKLEETASTATDASGNGGSGTWTGNATVVNGKYGHGITLDGTGDYVSVADSTALSTTAQVTIAAWVRPSTSIATKAIVVKDGSYRLVTDASGNPQCQVNDGSSWQTAATSATALSLSVWQHVACAYDGSVATVYVNGDNKGTSTYSVGIADSANTLRIGNDSGATFGDYNGRQDEVRIYNRGLSSSEVKALASWAAGPISYWNFEEGNNTITYDHGTTNGSGTYGATGGGLSNPDIITGKYGLAPMFTQVGGGTNANYINLGDNDGIEFDQNNSFTISLWVNLREVSTTNPFQTFLSDTNEGAGNVAGLTIGQNVTSGSMYIRIRDTADSYSLSTTNTMAQDSWQFVSYVFDRGTSLKIYVNGVEWTGTATGTLANVDSLANTAVACFGTFSGGASCNGQGGSTKIDEVRMYNYARSQTQLLEDMMDENTAIAKGNPAPIGYWNLDDITNSKSFDSSQYKDLQMLDAINAPTINQSGKVGRAVTLNGSSQYLSSPDTETLSVTGNVSVSAWIKPSAVTAATRFPIAGKATPSTISYLLEQFGDEIRMYIGSSSNYATTNAADLQTGTWYHVTGVYDSIAQTVSIYVDGTQRASTVTGTIPSSISDSNQGFAIGADDASLTYVITTNADDGTENNDTTWNASGLTGAINAFGFYSGVLNNINYGVRYQSVAIAQAATINVANFSLWFDGQSGVGGILADRIYGDNVDNAAAWAAGSRPSTISNTTASTDWNFNNYQNTTGKYWTYSPSVTAIVQEIVNRGSWASGNSMRFAVKRNTTSGINTIVTDDYTRSTYTPMRLNVNVNSASTKYYNGSIDEVKVYNQALTPLQVAFDKNGGAGINFANSTKEAEQLSDGIGTAPVGWYTIDENTGTSSVYDKSGTGNDLTMNNISLNAWENGKYGSSLRLDGSDDTLSRADDADFDFGTGSFTIQAWAKHPAIATNPDYLITKADTTNGGYKLYMDSSGNYCFAIDDDATFTPDDSACTSGVNFGDNAWHHIVGRKTTTSKIDIYVDSKLRTTDSTIAATATLSNTNALYVGADRDGTSNTWDGNVDEVKIYNYARTQAQISYDYNRGAPVGWWRMDECGGPTLYDVTGYGSNGTVTPGASGTNTTVGSCTSGSGMWGNGVSGKYNTGLQFDGTNDMVTQSLPSVLTFGGDITLAAWVFPTSLSNGILGVIDTAGTGSGGYEMYLRNASTSVAFCTGSSCGALGGSNNITLNTWQHIAVTVSGTTARVYVNAKEVTSATVAAITAPTATNMCIGADTNCTDDFFQGRIDDARIYNYALSATQMRILYNEGSGVRFGPVSGTPSP